MRCGTVRLASSRRPRSSSARCGGRTPRCAEVGVTANVTGPAPVVLCLCRAAVFSSFAASSGSCPCSFRAVHGHSCAGGHRAHHRHSAYVCACGGGPRGEAEGHGGSLLWSWHLCVCCQGGIATTALDRHLVSFSCLQLTHALPSLCTDSHCASVEVDVAPQHPNPTHPSTGEDSKYQRQAAFN